MPRTLFIADCHLSTERADIIREFQKFISAIAADTDSLYILGDLMDSWIGDDDSGADDIIASLRTLSRKMPVYFMHGNRDFLIGKAFAQESGITILRQPQVIDLYNRPTLIMHGDALCTDDRAYQHYRAVAQNPISKWLFRQLSLKTRRRFAAKLRQTSIQANDRKSPEIMDVSQTTVQKYMNRFNVKQLIHGHTHRPATHAVQTRQGAGQRIVLGDWYQRGNYLSVSDKQIEFVNL